MSVNDKISMEYEARTMINESQYLEISDYYLKRGGNCSVFTNKNIYFDRKDFFLINNHVVLRIREINGVPKEVTLKVRGKDGDKEITRIINNIDYSKSLFEQGLLSEEMLEALNNFNVSPLDIILITSLTTERIEVKEDDYLLVIDKNLYSDIIDYNLEVESTSRENAKKYLLMI